MKEFNGKFTAKIDFPIGYIYVTISDADIGSRKFLSYTDGATTVLVKFEQNCMVRTIQNFELKTKND